MAGQPVKTPQLVDQVKVQVLEPKEKGVVAGDIVTFGREKQVGSLRLQVVWVFKALQPQICKDIEAAERGPNVPGSGPGHHVERVDPKYLGQQWQLHSRRGVRFSDRLNFREVDIFQMHSSGWYRHQSAL